MAPDIFDNMPSEPPKDYEEESTQIGLFDEDYAGEEESLSPEEPVRGRLAEDFIYEDEVDGDIKEEEAEDDDEEVFDLLECLQAHNKDIAELKEELSLLREDVDEARKILAQMMDNKTVPEPKKPTSVAKKKKKTTVGRPGKKPPKVKVPKKKATKSKTGRRYK